MSKTDDVLRRISANIPKELLRGDLTKKIVDLEPEQKAREILKHPKVPQKVKRDIQRMLDHGAFKHEETVTDEETIAKIDKYNEDAVRKAIQSGELPDPNDDPYIKERNWKMRNRGNEISSYQSFMSAVRAVKDVKLLGSRVLVQVYKPAGKVSKIIIPDEIKNKGGESTSFAVVFRIGPDVRNIKEGQRVIIRKYGFDPLKFDDLLFMVGTEDDILGLVL